MGEVGTFTIIQQYLFTTLNQMICFLRKFWKFLKDLRRKRCLEVSGRNVSIFLFSWDSGWSFSSRLFGVTSYCLKNSVNILSKWFPFTWLVFYKTKWSNNSPLALFIPLHFLRVHLTRCNKIIILFDNLKEIFFCVKWHTLSWHFPIQFLEARARKAHLLHCQLLTMIVCSYKIFNNFC